MKYMGSKNRIAKHILPIMLKDKTSNQCWVEPFVGGGNMIDKVQGERIGSDYNSYTIAALLSIRDNLAELPEDNTQFTEAMYQELRVSDDYKHKGYVGYTASYGGKWLGGWRRDKVGKRDYVAESYRNAVQQSPNLQGVNLVNCSYVDLEIPNCSFIYCDPPYQHTTKYSDSFDHATFWQWCRDKYEEGHTIYVSEYNAPPDFIPVWQKEITSSLTKDTGGKKAVEKLFTLIF